MHLVFPLQKLKYMSSLKKPPSIFDPSSGGKGTRLNSPNAKFINTEKYKVVITKLISKRLATWYY